MIQYSKSSVRITEMHFEEKPGADLRTDVIRYQWRFEKIPGTLSIPLQTLFIDLTMDPEALLKAMNSTTRNEVRRGYKDPIQIQFDEAPSSQALGEFVGFYNQFAEAKKLPPANLERLAGMQATGGLILSSVRDAQGRPLVYHCYFRGKYWARLLHSASVYRIQSEKEDEKLVSRSNRHLHWRDMLALKELGVATYDFGGWYAGTDDEAKLKINTFKQGFGGQVIHLHNTYQGVTVKGRVAVQLHRWRGGE